MGVHWLGFDREAPPEEEAALLDVDPLRPLRQIQRDEDLHALGLQRLIARGVLAFEIGIDRYLDSAASAARRDKVDGGDAASLANEIDGVG